MKKCVFLSAFILLAVFAFAQMKKDRTSAFNYWQKGDLIKARDYIDKAIAYPEAATDAKVWYYRGGIYLDIQLKPEFKILAPDALTISYDAYTKSRELDVKEEYRSDIISRLQTIEGQLFNDGIAFFQAEDIDNALLYFEKAVKLGKEINVVDTVALFGSALCYEKKGDKAKAIEIYSNLVEMQMNEKNIYSSLAILYLDTEQNEKAISTIESGLGRFPGDNDLTVTQANVYIRTKQHEKALKSLNVAKEKEPGNASVLYAIGVTYDLMRGDAGFSQEDRDKYFDAAIKAYEETLLVDPAYFDALFNIGVLHFNRGGDLINAANKLPLSESQKYEELMADGTKYLQKALPYFENAEKIKPTDRDLLVSLKEIYTRLNLMEKLKEVNAKLQQ